MRCDRFAKIVELRRKECAEYRKNLIKKRCSNEVKILSKTGLSTELSTI